MKTRLTEKDKKLLMGRKVSERDTQLILNARAERGESVVLRGGILNLEIPDMGRRVVVVNFSWLCERYFRFDVRGNLVPKWELIPYPPEPCSQTVTLEFISYYFPKRGRRLKMWTSLGEYCRLYKPDDPDSLVKDGDDFILKTAAMPASGGGASLSTT